MSKSKKRQYTKMVVIGCGDVVRNRLIPAELHLARRGLLEQVAFLDIHRSCLLDSADTDSLGLPWHYFMIGEDCLLPLALLAETDLLGEDVLFYIAAPTAHHVWYAKQLAGTGARIAVEKPLTKRLADLEELRYFDDGHIFPVGHQLFKRAMWRTVKLCLPEALFDIRELTFDLLETKGVGCREVDDALWDLGWHGIECVLAIFRGAGVEVSVHPRSVQTARYEPLPGRTPPKSFSAALIRADLLVPWGVISLTIRVGKGMSKASKRICLRDAEGLPTLYVDLTESGWKAHYRLLWELLTKQTPQMVLGLQETASIVRACAEAEKYCTDEGCYEFGVTPPFLEALDDAELAASSSVSGVTEDGLAA